MDEYDNGEGGLEAFFSILYWMSYLLIVMPVTWLAKKIWRLDA